MRIRKHSLGHNNIDTAISTTHNLADTLFDSGQFSKALVHARESHRVFQSMSGDQHTYTKATSDLVKKAGELG